MPYLSVIIRTLNEARTLPRVLCSLKGQNFSDMEVIVVDSGSCDGTQSIARSFGCRLVEIPKGSFNYSFASNIGALHARGEILAFLSGHSVLADARSLDLVLHWFREEKVAGVYGSVLALPDGCLLEKLYHASAYAWNKMKGPRRFTAPKRGLLSCTNALLRADLWRMHPFEEQFGGGGEDMAWAIYWINQGYAVIRDPAFLVYHSHGRGIRGFIRDMGNWRDWTENVFSTLEIER